MNVTDKRYSIYIYYTFQTLKLAYFIRNNKNSMAKRNT